MNVVIVGATSGIGRELWKAYATGNNKIFVWGRRLPLLEQMKQERKEHTHIFPVDITKTEDASLCIQKIRQECNSIDLVIMCAGIGNLNDSLDYDVELATINTNVVAWTYIVDSFYKILEDQSEGHLVTITSVGGLTSSPLAPAYAATKAYQIYLTSRDYDVLKILFLAGNIVVRLILRQVLGSPPPKSYRKMPWLTMRRKYSPSR